MGAECPFNSMVVVDTMLVVTIEMPGSNFGLSNEPNMEFVDPYNNTAGSHIFMYERANKCNLEWITDAAAKADSKGINAVLIGFHARWWNDEHGARHYAYEGFEAKMIEVTTKYPKITFYTIHADAHFWILFSLHRIQNWINLMVEGSTPALTSYAHFSFTKDNKDDLVVKEVH